ncbi:EAL domain-containing protein [Thalassolituus sp. LLYu03]|uniref:EAL domain-containing protein n=1 Tax=Thalassolituus sp. LLYu03 TaxID=3421656 RepID=UPI003D2DBED6
MNFSPEHDAPGLLVLSTDEHQLQLLRDWLAAHPDGDTPATHFVLLDAGHRWRDHPLLHAEPLNWQAAIADIGMLCDVRREWLSELVQAVPTLLISDEDAQQQLPKPFHWLSRPDINRSGFFRSLRPLTLCLRDDLPAPLGRNEFFSHLRARLNERRSALFLQVVQGRWLRTQHNDSWRQQSSVQREFERSIQLRAPVNAMVGRLLDDQLVVISDNYYELQADWLPHHPDDDLRPWVVYHSAPLHLADISSLSAVLQEGMQQIARDRLEQEAQCGCGLDSHSLSLFDGLNLALQRDEFYLEYQPQFDSRTGAWVGAEALMRWRHPKLGVIPPTVFIREAEAAGLIQALGQWALRETASNWRRLCRETGTELRLAVNVSFPEIADPWYARQVLNILADTGMPPYALELELTETAMIRDASVSMLNLRQLKNAGVHIVLDDFGTGFSSLSHLSDLPLTGIKLDRAFISPLPGNPQQTHIVTSMLELAQRLNLETTAEGVEETPCLELVRRLGCDRIQGYVYAQPMPLDELMARAKEGFDAPSDFRQGKLF